MKAYSVGLETEVYLNACEISKLRNSTIEGELNFREVMDEGCKRQIPFRIVHDEFQEKCLGIVIIPGDCYFGDANMVCFIIDNEFYEGLSKSGKFGDRFLVSGKLWIYSENIK